MSEFLLASALIVIATVAAGLAVSYTHLTLPTTILV